jgi:uncharacterized repeat protein (TIGR01451 family)
MKLPGLLHCLLASILGLATVATAAQDAALPGSALIPAVNRLGSSYSDAASSRSGDPFNALPIPPDLSIRKTHTGNFLVGFTGVYSLVVTNDSASGSTTGIITVTDTLPTGLSYVSASGSGWDCSASGRIVTCTNINIILAGGSSSLSITVGVGAAAVPSVTNTASVATEGDTNTSNDSASDPTTVLGVPDIMISKTHTGNFTVGGNGDYSLIVSNVGSGSTSGTIVLTDHLPPGLSYVSGSGTGWSCSASGLAVTCTSSTPLAAGASSVLTLTVSVGAASVPSVINTATVSTAGDTNPANDTSSDTTTVLGIPDLSILKSHTGNLAVGANGVYTLAVTNVGNGSTTGTITITDTLPTGLAYVSGSGSGWSCSASGQDVTCTNPGPLAAGGSSSITLTVSVGPAAMPSVINTATVTTAGDTNSENNSSSNPTTVVAIPDLSISKTHTGNFTAGINGVYTLAVSNVGSAPTTAAITLTDTLPAGLGYVSGTGSGWNCSALGQAVTCTNAGPIAVGGSSSVTLTVSVGAGAVPSVTNTATVTTAGDTNTGNNSSSDPTTVGALSCNYSLSYAEATLPVIGGSSSTDLTSPAGCKWSAASNVPWIEISSGSPGNGNGTIRFALQNNPNSQFRTGGVVVRSESQKIVGTLVVVQLGNAPPAVRPRVEMSLDGSTYAPGATIKLVQLRLSGGSEARKVDWRMWLRLPDGTGLNILKLDGIDLAASQVIDVVSGAPVPFLAIQPDFPRGGWQIGNLLIDNPTGEFLSHDLDEFVIPASTSYEAAASGSVVDQTQTEVGQSFYFDRTIGRWQEFTPSMAPIDRLDFYLKKVGSPGDVHIEILYPPDNLLWEGSLSQASVADGWNSIAISPTLGLKPAAKYLIRLSASQDSTTVANRYYWEGSVGSTYLGGASDVESAWPGFDYAFSTYGDPARSFSNISANTSASSYQIGESLVLSSWVLRGGSEPKTFDWRMWFRLPDGTSLGVLRVDGISLPDGTVLNFTQNGPVSLVGFASGFPVGAWELGHRLVDSTTGITVALDVDQFSLSASPTK